ncbi:protein-L-histidine N-pros-methyltransferase-like isoform X2 [Mercenaria mercenaria]|uniref:protein-L-histidine N-pros-methyltransferase-like isoform X2 n=1 Tax=Mercenaria mercenaria TaxID=6596 RepID=UPI001E1D5D95|nr:protein-L-histidine N-pros-methyltransferase-like isoform X2 [Mercenaria mercenaria]
MTAVAFFLILSLLSSIEGTKVMYSFSNRRGRGTLARTIYNRVLEDEQHRHDNHSYWYFVKRSNLPADLCDSFLQLDQDSETMDFLENCYEKSDWVFMQIYHSVAKSLLSWFMENTSINGWLGRGSMFVFSRSQFTQLLDIDEDWKEESLLDLGAGDGEVTKMMAPYFNHIYATETSKPMVKRLNDKGYRVLDVESWDDGSISFDLVSCLNLLDRCDKPLSILHSIKKVLKPGGHVIVAVVLPFEPYVEFGPDNKPTEKIELKGHTFEEQSVSLVRDVFEPAGFSLVRFTRVPYLCEGDLETSFYVLDDALFVLKLSEKG